MILFVLHQDCFIHFFFPVKPALAGAKNQLAFIFPLVVKNQNPTHMYELLSILVKCH